MAEQHTKRYEEFAEKWLKGTITPEEAQEYAAWYNQQDNQPVDIPAQFVSSETALRNRMLNTITERNQLSPVIILPQRKQIRIKYTVAAAVLLLISSGIYLFLNSKGENTGTASGTFIANNDALPGTDRAILTLADGSSIDLNHSANGTISQQGNATVNKLDNQLVYTADHTTKATITYNTMTTPKGGQYKLQLPDGTMVWLNAASSIRFPTAFHENKRTVTVTGEAYFEVAKDAQKTFTVILPGASSIEVLGTHFNVNTYPDESDIRTTLLEGKVRVIHRQKAIMLDPQQQAIIHEKQIQLNRNVVIEQVMAWKNGLLNFEGADLKTIIRQLARWYDVEPVYEGNISSEKFAGEMDRSLKLSQVLKLLKHSGVNFRIEGKKLIITP